MISKRLARPQLLAFLALFSLCVAVRPAAAIRQAETTGTALGYDVDSGLLRVNTRLGPKSFIISTSTLVLLNNHTTNIQNIQTGDEVAVLYRFDTAEASVVEITRERRIAGLITAATSTTLTLRIARGATLSFTVNSSSRMNLEEIMLADARVLAGRRATIVYEPGNNLLVLSLEADSSRLNGRISAVDTTARTVTLAGKSPRVVTLDELATVRRTGSVVALSELVVGDRAVIAYVRDGTTLRGLAIRTRP